MASKNNVETVRIAPEAPAAEQSTETAEQKIARLQAELAATRQEVVQSRMTSGAFGENVEAKLDGHILTLKIDVSKRLRASKEGKSMLIATTGGNQEIALPGVNGARLGVNFFVPNRR